MTTPNEEAPEQWMLEAAYEIFDRVNGINRRIVSADIASIIAKHAPAQPSPDVLKAADELCKQLRYVHASESYMAVWRNIAGVYSGPFYQDELAALEKALEQARAQASDEGEAKGVS